MSARRIIQVIGAASCLLTLALLFWPLGVPPPSPPSQPASYKGANHLILKVASRQRAYFDVGSPVADAQAEGSTDAPRLVGIAGNAAYLDPAGDEAVQAAASGDVVGGWTVRRIGDRQVIVDRGGETRTLTLYAATP